MDICIYETKYAKLLIETSGRFISYDEYLKIISAN